MTHIGVDEAGRGPVLGSMFVAGVAIPQDHPVRDQVVESKSTTVQQITTIVRSLYHADSIRIQVREVTAQQIDECESITTLTSRVMDEISQSLADASNDAHTDLFVDACHSSPEQFKAEFDTARYASTTVEHKADENHSSVSAAGCVAKLHREKHIENLNEKYTNFQIGSGYPSDTTTRNFLEEYYTQTGEFPTETRVSWNTCEDLK